LRCPVRGAEYDRGLPLDALEGCDGGVDRRGRVARPYRCADDDGIVAGDVDDSRLNIGLMPRSARGMPLRYIPAFE